MWGKISFAGIPAPSRVMSHCLQLRRQETYRHLQRLIHLDILFPVSPWVEFTAMVKISGVLGGLLVVFTSTLGFLDSKEKMQF